MILLRGGLAGPERRLDQRRERLDVRAHDDHIPGFERGVIPAPPRVAKVHPRLLDGPTACVEGPVVKSSLGMGGHNGVMVLEAAST